MVSTFKGILTIKFMKIKDLLIYRNNSQLQVRASIQTLANNQMKIMNILRRKEIFGIINLKLL